MAQASIEQGQVIDVQAMLASKSLNPYQAGLLPQGWTAPITDHWETRERGLA
jgi:hypothetical protein